MYKPVRIGAILCNDQFQLGKSSHRDPVTKDQVQIKGKIKQHLGCKSDLPVVN